MTKIIAPKIPKGNSNKIYVLSDTSAKEFLKESQDIIKKHWPFTEKDSIAESKTKEAYLELRLIQPFPADYTSNEFSLDSGIVYSEKDKSGETIFSSGARYTVLEFVGQSPIPKDSFDDNTHKVHIKEYNFELEKGSNVFVYKIFNPEKLNFSNLFCSKYFKKEFNPLLTESDKKHLNDLLVPEFQKISDELKDSLEKRSAIITSSYFNSFYTM